MSELKLKIDGKECVAQPGQTILEVARANGIEIPTLCQDARAKTYGACGLCVVEVENSPKLFRSCATMAGDGMCIHTQSDRVKESRKTALEFLMTDHDGDCRPPCALACPANTDCQGYIGLIANGEFEEALKVTKEKLPLPASIGRVCPHPCEKACRRANVEAPIAIANLKTFMADTDLHSGHAFLPECAPATGKTVAIVGGGPGGLSSAYFLAQKGHRVTIFDAMPKMGGMLRYGIPEYRLPKAVLDQEIALIEKLGVTMKNGVKVGADLTLDDLKSQYDAVVVAIGAWVSRGMRCKGEDQPGVVGGIDFLRGVALGQPMEVGEKVAVVGGGNTAMDACRTAVRLGAKEVFVVYRRTKDEMPADLVEIEEAEEEGVVFKYLTNPLEFIARDGKVAQVLLQKMQLGEPDASGRRSPVPIQGETEIMAVDTVIMAIGQGANLSGFEPLEQTRRGTIAADEETFMTSVDGVFAIGDVTNKGASIAIEAIGEAQKSTAVIDGYLRGETVYYRPPYVVERKDLPQAMFDKFEKKQRIDITHVSAEERKTNFKEIVHGYTPEKAMEEANRCLQCGCQDYYRCKLYQYANQYDIRPERLAGEKHRRTVADTHPYLLRNPDKCILCGLCVRVCEETVGAGALGLVNRGFDTIVKPALDQPLETTDCVSCGLCAAVCPTGALIEKEAVKKQVPVQEESQIVTCSYCSNGCQIDLRTRGGMALRALPLDGQMLCALGRFGTINEKNGVVKGKFFIDKSSGFTPIDEDIASRLVPGIDPKQVLKGLSVVCERSKKYGS